MVGGREVTIAATACVLLSCTTLPKISSGQDAQNRVGNKDDDAISSDTSYQYMDGDVLIAVKSGEKDRRFPKMNDVSLDGYSSKDDPLALVERYIEANPQIHSAIESGPFFRSPKIVCDYQVGQSRFFFVVSGDLTRTYSFLFQVDQTQDGNWKLAKIYKESLENN